MFRNASDANLNVNALDEEEIEGSCEPDDDDDDEEASVLISSKVYLLIFILRTQGL